MVRIFCIISVLVLGAVLPADGKNLGAALKKLDSVIENRETYAEMTETRIDELKEQLAKASAPEERYHYLDMIEETYRCFCIDSSFSYINRKKELATSMGDPFFICAYNLNYADMYTKSGCFLDAEKILESCRRSTIPPELYGYYLTILKNLYELQMESAILPKDRERYREMLDANIQDRIAFLSNKDTVIDMLMHEGRYDEAEDLINMHLSEVGNTHSRSMYLYILSRINGLKSEKGKRMYNLALTAINDMTLGIREHKALSELAIMLYSDGDIKRADKYLRTAIDDAALCGARPRYLESVDFFTTVDSAYQAEIDRQNRYIILAMTVISLLALAMAILISILYKKNSKLQTARRNLHEAYNSLSEVNRRLQESYRKLEDTTNIKDEYIGMYMDQCSTYLSKLDSYRKSLRKMLNVGSMDELSKAIKSGEFVEQEVREFYANFDVAFLHLYPSFIEEFNELLKEEERTVPESNDKLTAELRIYALIRLGIDDSVKIAQFLRYSVSTIYNYRTKMRNKAKGDRNTFDEQVKKIGIP